MTQPTCRVDTPIAYHSKIPQFALYAFTGNAISHLYLKVIHSIIHKDAEASHSYDQLPVFYDVHPLL